MEEHVRHRLSSRDICIRVSLQDQLNLSDQCRHFHYKLAHSNLCAQSQSDVDIVRRLGALAVRFSKHIL